MPTVRCFAALRFPDQVNEILERAAGRLARSGAAVRWVRSRNLHVTVKFFGDVAPSRLQDICLALREISFEPFGLSIRGLGRFPAHGRARVIWAGLDGDLARLESLVARIEDALEAVGVERDQRPFRVHLTLGRVKDARGAAELQKELDRATLESEAVTVDHLILYRSLLTADGPVYEEIERFGARN